MQNVTLQNDVLHNRSDASCRCGRLLDVTYIGGFADHTVTGLVTELIESREERHLQRLQKQLQRLHLIVLDEARVCALFQGRS